MWVDVAGDLPARPLNAFSTSYRRSSCTRTAKIDKSAIQMSSGGLAHPPGSRRAPGQASRRRPHPSRGRGRLRANGPQEPARRRSDGSQATGRPPAGVGGGGGDQAPVGTREVLGELARRVDDHDADVGRRERPPNPRRAPGCGEQVRLEHGEQPARPRAFGRPPARPRPRSDGGRSRRRRSPRAVSPSRSKRRRAPRNSAIAANAARDRHRPARGRQSSRRVDRVVQARDRHATSSPCHRRRDTRRRKTSGPGASTAIAASGASASTSGRSQTTRPRPRGHELHERLRRGRAARSRSSDDRVRRWSVPRSPGRASAATIGLVGLDDDPLAPPPARVPPVPRSSPPRT